MGKDTQNWGRQQQHQLWQQRRRQQAAAAQRGRRILQSAVSSGHGNAAFLLAADQHTFTAAFTTGHCRPSDAVLALR